MGQSRLLRDLRPKTAICEVFLLRSMAGSRQRRLVELEALARISEAVSDSLYLEESLAAYRAHDDGRAPLQRARRSCSTDGEYRVARGTRRGIGGGCRCAGRGRQIGELVCDRDTPFTDDDRQLLCLDRAPCGGRARARARRDARRARARDPPPGQEQPADRRVAAAPAGARDRRRRPARGARALGEPDPRDRRGARGARRSGATTTSCSTSCSTGCARCSCRGSAAASTSSGARAGRPAGSRATALALVFSELLQNALEHGGAGTCASSSRRGNGESSSRSPTRAQAPTACETGTGLSIVRALVRDELKRPLRACPREGTRAEVVFPA